ncbi:putative Ig domain-containing protein [Spirosoma rigui]|uniref:putative Ig domain-containing protein n=1 Tax=Spirosoma rigui TaxID=564064 RepID=UPI0009B1100F|nr:putative Ig domain-containing protein [Spirosoma rigui]
MKHRLLLLNIFAAILVSLTWASAQTKYTANFATQPTIDKYGFANDWPWNSTVTVNLGGVDYLITDAINGSWGWNGSAVTHSTAGDVYYKIVRKDGKTFNFFGVKLQYTNVTNAPEFYKYPFLTVDYASVGTTVADELYDSNRTVTVSKPNGVPVSNVILRFSGVLELVLDDLIVGPIAGQLVAPTVTTNAASSISTNSAVLGGSVTADGGGAVTSRGVVYSNTNNTPTIGGNSVTQSANGTGTGTFAQTISGLTPNTNYYTRAYAVNSSGTGYGAVQTFTTTQLTTAAPVVLVPANGSMVTTTTPTYGGNAPATSTVALYVDGTSIGTVTANGAGNWARTQPTTLAQGSHTVYATAQLNGQTVSANSSTNTFTVDSVRPSLSITSTASEPTNVSPISVTITFSEAVTGFVAGDLTVSNGTLSGFSGSGSSYSVNVTPTTSGVVTLNVPANVAQDAAGNGNTASTPFSRQYQFPNSTPTDIQLSQTTVAENQPNGTTVGTLTSTDADTPAQTFTYALVSGNGDTDNAAFSVEGTTLKTARSFDFESKASYSIRVRTTDSGSPAASFEKTFTLTLTDQNELVATFTSQTNVSCFDQANGSLTVSATGEAGPYTYRWSAGSSTSATLSGLTAGPYSVTVTAAKGFTAVATTTLTQPAAVLAPVLEASAFTTTNQPITVTANGCPGGALNWALSGGTGQATSTTFSLTQPGNYTLTASCTLNGCTGPYSAPVALQIRPGGFAITGVSAANCQLLDAGRGLYEVRLTPQYGDASGPISFSIVNELSPTTAPGPYTLRLYSDNPMITLVATQSGSPEARFVYNWLAACSAGTSPNRPPVARSIPDQTLPQGQAYSLELANYITDPDGQPLTFAATGLPADLSLVGSRISGTAATTGVNGITIKALDPAGLEVTTQFQLTITPLISTPAGFTIVAVTTVSCQTLSTGQRQVQFLPQYGGVTGQVITFQVINELAPTQQAGPYTLNLYTDNPVISLQATQTGSTAPATYRYNWLAGCGTTTTPSPANRAPVVGSGVASQTATVGQGYTLVIPAGTFTDPDGDALSLSATGLPAGLSFAGSTLTGTPSTTGVSTVNLTAVDPAGLSATLSFTLTVVPTTGNPPSADFAITTVGTLQCEVISAGQRRVSFTPQYSGVSGSPISFSVVNELSPTTAPGPYSLTLYTDNPTITLQAQQGSSVASYRYEWLAACNARGRQGAAELSSPLQVTVLGNPVVGQQVRVEVRGAEGQSLRLSLTDQQGRSVSDQTVERAGSVERQTLQLLHPTGGLLLLRVSTSTLHQTVKLIKAD